MDNNFQTSFIPKKPLAEERAQVIQHSSIFSFIATLLFFGALAAAAGMYFYKASLTKQITTMSAQLDASRNSFEPTLIATLQTLDRRITTANQLLERHIVVSPIFDALQINTLKSVQFTKFSYVTPADVNAPILVKMSGKARDYASIALQSDQLATNTNIHNSIFSNLALDSKTGMVGFDLNFNIDASLVRFVNHLNQFTSQEGTPSTTSPTATSDDTSTTPPPTPTVFPTTQGTGTTGGSGRTTSGQ